MQRRIRRGGSSVDPATTRLGAALSTSLLLGPSLPAVAVGGTVEVHHLDRGAVAFVVLLAVGGAATVAMARRVRAARPIRDREDAT